MANRVSATTMTPIVMSVLVRLCGANPIRSSTGKPKARAGMAYLSHHEYLQQGASKKKEYLC